MGTEDIKKACTVELVQAFAIPICVIWNQPSRHWIAAQKHTAMTGEACLAPTVVHTSQPSFLSAFICEKRSNYSRFFLRIKPPHPDPQPKDPLPGGVEAPNSPSVPTRAPLAHALPDTALRPPA